MELSIDTASTLWKRWSLNAKNNPDREAIIHWIGGEKPVRWTFGNLIETAKKISIQIKKAGIKKGDVCAIIVRHNPLFYPLYLGISRTGALPAVLAYPNPRLHPDKFRQGIEGMSQRSGLDWILTEKELDPMIRPLVEKEGSTIKSILFPLEWNLDPEENLNDEIEQASHLIDPSEPVLLQHSSGTTGLQKPVVLSHRAILEHVKNCAVALNLSDLDKIASWLPLYHDMGLIAAFHLPLAYGIPSIQIDPFEWVLAPILLLEAVSKEKATISWLPNFAYNIFADKVPEDEMEDFNLNSWRLTINCSEPVRHDSHQKFVERFEKYGFDPLSLGASYAMAETTFAVTQTEPGKPIHEITVDRNELSNGKVVRASGGAVSRVCVSSGKLINGCEVKIVDDKRNELPAGSVGEIAIKSVSMFDGYRNYPEKTAEVVDNGWYYSGDYGFEYENEFYVIGRKKDLIIVAGKNIYPEDVENVVSRVEGVIPGRVIAFGEEDESLGTEQVSIVAETKAETDEERNKLRMDVLKAGMGIDINIHKVYFVPSRWLIKSSAGKPSRSANKQRIFSREDKQVWSR